MLESTSLSVHEANTRFCKGSSTKELVVSTLAPGTIVRVKTLGGGEYLFEILNSPDTRNPVANVFRLKASLRSQQLGSRGAKIISAVLKHGKSVLHGSKSTSLVTQITVINPALATAL
jgi:hypothetical protein